MFGFCLLSEECMFILHGGSNESATSYVTQKYIPNFVTVHVHNK